MNTNQLKTFAQEARLLLEKQVGARLEQVFEMDSAYLREQQQAVNSLRMEINKTSKKAVIEKVAYTWFNRFCALRYMDVNHFTSQGIVSAGEGETQPEILKEAKQGLIVDELKPFVNEKQVMDLLNGVVPSVNPQQEVYRLLLVGVCNAYHKEMPFLFEGINNYSALLMPEDLLSERSILQKTREALDETTCRDVEVIGWLYQYYISEKKDAVMARRSAVPTADIPAVTQLFTPHWIVRYMVENSLGRLWMLNNPQSSLVEKMEYYIPPSITPAQGEGHKGEGFIRLSSPEEIRLCDPACGSGHILTYAFDLLYEIYSEAGYDSQSIPKLILEKNLYGIEIDERAGMLAGFALMMKARAKDRRFFTRQVKPNICVLENVSFTPGELVDYRKAVGDDLFTQDLWALLQQFEDVKTVGSLVRPAAKDLSTLQTALKTKGVFDDLLLHGINVKVQQVLDMALYLSQRYQVVVANPPYMGSKGMNAELKDFAKDFYPDSKSDLFAMFIERNLDLALPKGQLGFMTPFVWMFISSYEKLRKKIIGQKNITSLIQLEYSGFDGATVPICTFTLENGNQKNYYGGYIRLSDFRGAKNQAPKTLEAIKYPDCGWFFRANAKDFQKIPGSPIAYWVSDRVREVFEEMSILEAIAEPRVGLDTGNNDQFLRLWFEVEYMFIGQNTINHSEFLSKSYKYVPHTKGGDFRKWYGNYDYVLKFDKSNYDKLSKSGNKLPSRQYYFLENVTWTRVSSSKFATRFTEHGFVFNSACPSIFAPRDTLEFLQCFLSTKLVAFFVEILSPTLNFQAGEIRRLPIKKIDNYNFHAIYIKSKKDWDSYETSWDFSSQPLVEKAEHYPLLKEAYTALRQEWLETTLEMQRLEEENNRIFIEAYGLQEELTPEVPLEEITLTCNPAYRYGGNSSPERLEQRLLEDTLKELVSYAVGCMFGRYSLDQPGLVLANAGEGIKDYQKQIPQPSFLPLSENVLPIVAGDWFAEDAPALFKRFLKTTFGEAQFESNLSFLETSLGRSIEDYFLKEFYADHVQTYKKRPIYWLFSSPKGSFNALIYLHRYRKDTVSLVLNSLRTYRDKLAAHQAGLEQMLSHGASEKEKALAIKQREDLQKIILELDEYERETLYPLAARQIELDLDDGVKINYEKFGKALKKI
ncbi:MAG: SAM-dependent methyltransferase [Anaerolineaceae bacterium]|nr:SAM-dependent methyltransferase [Anaerolineaceae bacterium]